MIVVDVGCVPHGKDESMLKLIRRFRPSKYYGFDPLLDVDAVDLIEVQRGSLAPNSTRVVLAKRAAWIRNGSVAFAASGITSSVIAPPPDAPMVECFDFAQWVAELPRDEVVVKIDAEGAEYALIDKMHATGVDGRLTLLLVEWHDVLPDADAWKARLLADLRCPVEEWT